MWVVAGDTGKPSLTRAEAGRLAQPVAGAVDFELVVKAGPGRMVKFELVGGKGFSGAERIGSVPEDRWPETR
jgi:hypothetical protein